MTTKPKLPVPSEAETRYEITIPWWRPASLNELLRGGRWGARKLKARDRRVVCDFARYATVPAPEGRRRVSLRIVLPKGQRRWDIDALQKSTLDACTHAGLIRDDGPKWAEWGRVDYVRGERLSTTIIIESIDD